MTTSDTSAGCATSPERLSGSGSGSGNSLEAPSDGREPRPGGPRLAFSAHIDAHGRIAGFRQAENWLTERQIGPIV